MSGSAMMRVLRWAAGVGLCVLGSVSTWAQQPKWHDLLRDPHARFEDIRRAYEQDSPRLPDPDEGGEEEEGEGDAIFFGRWADFWELRLMPDGSFPNGEILWQELQAKIAQQRARKAHGKGAHTHSTANFVHVGPVDIPSNGGAGRINCIAFHPTNSSTVFVGAPSGGLWKSTNSGSSWTSSTDTLATLGVSAIAIDPTNPQIIYIGTGDRDARDTYGVGILKSTNGGATWNATGLNWTTPQNRTVCDIVIFPTNTSVLLAATSIGIWRSTNGGQSWSQRTTSYTMELRLHPTNPAIVFATTYNQSGGAAVMRSTDGGVSWSTVWSNASVNRIALALSPSAPRRIYALCSSASGSSFYGLYMSLDTGSTWTQQSSTPNILGSNTSGTSSGGQGWYDLCLTVHPTDSTMLFAGGINIWRSTNSGQSWSIVSYWQSGSSVPYVHADQHCMLFKPGTTELWVGNDGGVFRSTNLGNSWTDLSGGLAILQIYRLSIQRGASSPAILAGTQDNGTNRRTSAGAWAMVYGGDGMENGIDWNTPVTMYCSIYYGNFYRSTNGGSNWSTITPSGEANNGSWMTPFQLDPQSPQTLYAAYRTVYRSTNRGSNWTSLGTPLSARATFMAVASSNTNIIVVGTRTSLYRTTNAGQSWSSIVGNLPSSLSNAAIDPGDPSVMWVTCSNWSSGQKVFRSTDGGSTWSNVSSGLPNVPVNCIALDRQGGAYVGTDIGVYYRAAGSSEWVSHDDGLPNVIVRDIELDTALGRIYVGTYGRGVWQGAMVTETFNAAIWASRTTICSGDTVRFADASSGSISTRQWNFSGGTPASSTDSAITVLFASPGLFQIQLIVAAGSAADTAVITITVNPRPTVSISASAPFACEGDSIVVSASGTAIARYQWSTGDTTQHITLRAVGVYSVRVTVISAAGCSTTSIAVQCTIAARPPVPVVAVVGQRTFCQGDSAILRAPDGYPLYLWSTGATTQSITVRSAGSYTVTVTDANGCSQISEPVTITVHTPPLLTVTRQGQLQLCQGDSVVFTAQSAPGVLFRWQDGTTGNRYVARTSGTYVVIATDTNGCSTTSQQFGVTVHPQPAPQLLVRGRTVLCPDESTTLELSQQCAHYRWNTGDTTPTLTVRQSGSYWCVCTSAVGCSGSSDTVTIAEDTTPPPMIRSLNGRLEACQGDTLMLEASAGYIQYRWSTGSASVRLAVTESDVYSVAAQTEAGCWKTSDTVYVQFRPAPPTPTIVRTGNVLTCPQMASAYQWYLDGQPLAGATTYQLVVTALGRYSVRITNEYGCSAESASLDVVSSVEGDHLPELELVPNPADEYVLVRCRIRSPLVRLELVDLTGRTLAEAAIPATSDHIEYRLDVTGISAGLYTVIVRSGSTVVRGQVAVLR